MNTKGDLNRYKISVGSKYLTLKKCTPKSYMVILELYQVGGHQQYISLSLKVKGTLTFFSLSGGVFSFNRKGEFRSCHAGQIFHDSSPLLLFWVSSVLSLGSCLLPTSPKPHLPRLWLRGTEAQACGLAHSLWEGTSWAS